MTTELMNEPRVRLMVESADDRGLLAEEELQGSEVVGSHLHGGVIVPLLQLAIVTHTEWHARPPAPKQVKRLFDWDDEQTERTVVRLEAKRGLARVDGTFVLPELVR